MNVALLSLERGTLEQPLKRPPAERSVVRVGDVDEAACQQFLLGVTGQGAQRPVDLQPASVKTDQAHPDRSVFERRLKALRRLRQRGLLGLLGGDVAHRPDDLHQLSLLVDAGAQQRLDPFEAAVGAPDTALEFGGTALLHPPSGCVKQTHVLGVDQIAQAAPDQRLRLPTDHLDGAG